MKWINPVSTTQEKMKVTYTTTCNLSHFIVYIKKYCISSNVYQKIQCTVVLTFQNLKNVDIACIFYG